jgi:ketosteroid isomerase-like protein
MDSAMDARQLQVTVTRLNTIQEISELMYDYGYYVDINDADKLAALFTEDCTVTYAVGFGASSLEEYRRLLGSIGDYFAGTAHYVTNLKIDLIDDSHARVRAMVVAWHRYMRERPDSHWMGYYFNEVRRVDGTWLIHKLEMRTVGMAHHHLPPESLIPLDRR